MLKEERKSREKKEVKFKSGSVCVVKSSQHEELLNRAGCWAIVKEVNDDGCTIAFWDGIVAGVSPDELKMSTATVKDYKKKYGSLLKNLSVVDGDKLDGAAKILVQYLEKKEEPVLNEFEKGLVSLLKKKYKKTESVEAEDKSEEAEISNELGTVQQRESEQLESEDKSEEAEKLSQVPADSDVTTEEVDTSQKDLLTDYSQAALAKRLRVGATTVGTQEGKEGLLRVESTKRSRANRLEV